METKTKEELKSVKKKALILTFCIFGITICLFIYLVSLLIAFGAIEDPDVENERYGNEIKAKLNNIANKYCPKYNMQPLEGAYLMTMGYDNRATCINYKDDGSIDYYYLNDNYVPLPYDEYDRRPAPKVYKDG